MRRFLENGFFLFWLLVTIGVLPMQAQEFNSTQYYSNLPSINPGFTGIDDHLDLKTSVNQGWNSFDITNNNFYVSAYSALNNSKRVLVKNNTLRISSSTYGDRQSEKQLRRKHGMGGMLSGRTIGPYRSLAFSYNYAYHIPLSSKFSFSLGTKLALFNQRTNFSGFKVRDEVNDIFYQQLISSGNANQNSLLMDFGAVLYSEKFYVALTSGNLIKGKLSGDDLLNYSEAAQYQLHVAGNFRMGQTVMLNVGSRLALKQGYEATLAINARFRYKEILYFGSAFSSNSQLSLLVGVAFSPNFYLHYSYDQYLSSLNNFNVNAHEVVLGISIFNKTQSHPKFW